MSFAFINGARLYYEDSGTGTPLIFVHAGIADSRMWDTQMSAFRDAYRVIRMDLRGYGQTSPTEGVYSHREDVLALMDTLSIDRAILVGCSMSGGMAIDLTLDQPQRVLALVVVGAVASGFNTDVDLPPSPYDDEMNAAEEAGDLQRLNELEMLYWVAGQGRTREDVDPLVWALASDMNLIALKNEGHGEEKPRLQPPAMERLNTLKLPVPSRRQRE